MRAVVEAYERGREPSLGDIGSRERVPALHLREKLLEVVSDLGDTAPCYRMTQAPDMVVGDVRRIGAIICDAHGGQHSR